jgi:hypothetical protein
MTEGCVYALIDPRTNDPRYVGATKDPHQRLRRHLLNPPNEKMEQWIEELESEGLSPAMTLLRWADVQELRDEEQDILNRLFEEYELLNIELNSNYPSISGGGRSGGLRKTTHVETPDEPSTESAGESVDVGQYRREVVNEQFEPSPEQDEILELLTEDRGSGGPWGLTNLADVRQRTSINEGNVSYHLDKLVTAGWVDRRARGLYVFNTDPRENERSSETNG